MSADRQNRRSRRATARAERRSVSGPNQSLPSGSPLPIARSLFSGRALWISLALIVVNLVIYAPVRHYEFVTWDDPQYITENPHVSGGLTWPGVSWAFTAGYFYNWHPLTWLSHMLDVQLYGMNAGGHHLTNLLLHIATTILLFGLLHRMTGALGRSAFVGGLFAVHPLHVESVAWVAERKDVLSTLFGMLTLWGYIAYLRQPRLGRYLVMLLLFALGLMSKPMLVTLPFVLLLLDFWPLGRVSLGAESSDRSGSAPSREQWSVRLQLAWEKLPFLALAVASSIVTFVVQQRGGAVAQLDALPLNLRVANALLSYVAYIGKMLWPTRLAVFYPYSRSLPEWEVIGAALGLIGVSVVVIGAARRYPYLPVGWLWYLGTLVPVIGLVQVGGQAMADRYTYVPFIGLFIMVSWGAADLLARWQYRSIALPITAGLALLACAIIARGQARYWRNTMALWAHALEVTSENYVAHNGLGVALVDQGRNDEAIAHYSEALRFKPNFREAHNNLGNALVSLGRSAEAIPHFSKALLLKPDSAEVHNGLGAALARQEKVTEAIHHYFEALRLKPDFADPHNNLGLALVDQGRVSEAIAHYSEALRIKPDYALAHNNLGIALANQEKVGEAVTHFSEALRIKPEYAEAHNNLGSLLAKQGRGEESIAHFSEALRIKPDYADAHDHLGRALTRQGRVDEAIAHYSEALRINPSHPQARSALDELTSRGKKTGLGTP